jgi:hypothetical protein
MFGQTIIQKLHPEFLPHFQKQCESSQMSYASTHDNKLVMLPRKSQPKQEQKIDCRRYLVSIICKVLTTPLLLIDFISCLSFEKYIEIG